MTSERKSPNIRDPRHAIRYLVAGGLNTLFGLSIYPILIFVFMLREHYLLALLLAQSSSLIFAFSTYKAVAFRTKGNTVREFSKFVPVYLINYAVAWIFVPILVEKAGCHPVVVQLMFVTICIITSYIWHNMLTFRRAPERDPDQGL